MARQMTGMTILFSAQTSTTAITNPRAHLKRKPTIPLVGSADSLVAQFLSLHDAIRSQSNVVVDGENLTIASVVAIARLFASPALSTAPRDRVEKSRHHIESKLQSGNSVYGVTTGYGGSADTRTHDHEGLGLSLLQHQHSGIVSSADPRSFAATTMPEAWVRAAMLIRANSLVRGHSGVRWHLIERMVDLLRHHVSPIVPLRGTISASGDLAPLSYVAGALIGEPTISCTINGQDPIPATDALLACGLEPVKLADKEHLGILNGTAFSAGLASLVFTDATQLMMLAQVCTAMGVEALRGTQASFHSFIHDECRPHPGQIEVARNVRELLRGSQFAASENEKELKIEDDKHSLRQDRYALRTAPQWLGPTLESTLAALRTISLEINSTTDNPLIDPATGHVHHGGNFQAMALTLPLAQLTTSLFTVGKILFAQVTELLNPQMNRGLPPNCAGWDPSTDYGGKGIDIACAAYSAELGGLANAATGTITSIQSAEIHNQSVNSMAFVVGRRANEAVDVLSMLIASYLYALVQALDLRALQVEFYGTAVDIIDNTLLDLFPGIADRTALLDKLRKQFEVGFEANTSKDSVEQCSMAAATLTPILLDSVPASTTAQTMALFTKTVASQTQTALVELRSTFLTTPGFAASRTVSYLGPGSRKIYEFIRLGLRVPMHGRENLEHFEGGLGSRKHGRKNVGEWMSMIYDSIRDGRMAGVVADIFRGVDSSRVNGSANGH